MSIKDLEEAGVLLPEEEWGTRSLETTTHKPALVAIGFVATVASVLMYYGGGRSLTWLGGILFLIALFAFTWLSLRAVDAQVARSRKASSGEEAAGSTEEAN